MDIVYILGTESSWNDNEIRFSLRSLCMHLNGITSIIIVGAAPKFIDFDIYDGLSNPNFEAVRDVPIIWVDHLDNLEFTKERRIMEKVKFACQHDLISEDFLFMNDDFFLLQPMHVSEVKNYFKGDLKTIAMKREHKDRYFNAQLNCHNALSGRGFTTHDFDTHVPIIYNKKKFIDVMNQYDWNVKDGYVVKSLYANSLGLSGEFQPDCKIDQFLNVPAIYDRINGRQWFSIGDSGVSSGMKEVLNELYPKQSVYEY